MKEQLQEQHKQTKLGHGIGGRDGVTQSVSPKIPSLTASPKARESSSW